MNAGDGLHGAPVAVPEPAPGRFSIRPTLTRTIDADGVLASLGRGISAPAPEPPPTQDLTLLKGAARKVSVKAEVAAYAAALVQECADSWDDAMSVDLDMQIFPGSAPSRTDIQRIVLARELLGRDTG